MSVSNASFIKEKLLNFVRFAREALSKKANKEKYKGFYSRLDELEKIEINIFPYTGNRAHGRIQRHARGLHY